MRLRVTIAMLEIRNRKTPQSKVNICKSDVKIGDYADSLQCTFQSKCSQAINFSWLSNAAEMCNKYSHHQNAPNCTIYSKFSRVAYAPKPLANKL